MTFTYDPLGNMLTASRGGDGNGATTMTLTYDKAGRKLTMDDPDMGDWSYVYNALGGMTSQTDARGCVLTMGYDELNRPTSKSSSGAGCVSQVSATYTYDAGTNGKGRRTSMTDASGSATWIYDARGRVTKETKVISSVSFVTEWTYNLADLPETMKYPDGEIVTTDYNNNMQPTDVSGTNNYVPSMTYDSAGRLLTRALGNGLTQNYTYYPWNQQGGRLKILSTGTLQNLTYQYDSVGNIAQIANSVAGETSVYDYDALDRLTSWQLNQNSPETYTYDAQGNLDVKNGLNLNYNDANHKHAVTHIGAAQKYWYDDNGNQVTRIVGADTFDLAYDAENRLVEVKKNDVTISQFTYNGDGQRVKSVIDGETIRFVGGYYERKGSEITKYYMAGATRVAMRKYTIPQRMTVEYMLGDHLGSTSITTDTNGAMISEMRYKPWGETRYTWTNAPGNTSPVYELVKYQFTGQYSYDVEFGLKYYGARFYDSAVGRFSQADTLIPQEQGTQAYDRYAYTNNNPLRYTDPTGHRNCEEDGYGCDDDETETGVLTEEQLIEFGLYCGENVSDLVCQLYLDPGAFDFDMNIEFADWLNVFANPNLGTAASCLTIWQGCAFEGLDYKMVFQTEANPNGGVDWNRSADFHGIVLPLFFANWKSDTYNGAPVANETFPLRGGGLGYASVLLAPSAQNNGIVWTSVGVEYDDIPVPMPGTIVFQTSQTSATSIQTTGSFTLDGGTVVGSIYLSGNLK